MFFWWVEIGRKNLGMRNLLFYVFLWCDFKWNERADLWMDGLIHSCKSGVILVYNVGDYENTLFFSRIPCKVSVMSWFPYLYLPDSWGCMQIFLRLHSKSSNTRLERFLTRFPPLHCAFLQRRFKIGNTGVCHCECCLVSPLWWS